MFEFHSSKSFNKNINASFITLLPKCTGLSNFSDYHPISLIGCNYKILAKVLANRLKNVISSMIGVNQFAFIKGRQILDCSLIANEIVNSFKKNRSGGLLFKMDFEKGFDCVD